MKELNLQSIILKGSLVRTKFEKTEWISNVVYEVSQNRIHINLAQEYINKLIMVGDPLKCKVSTPETEYVLDGVVDSIQIEDRTITIRIEKINKFENIRENNRYDAYIISRITINRENTIFSVVTSLSNSGISVVSKSEIPSNSDTFVEVFIDSGNTIRFYGNMVRKTVTENGYEYGIKFKQLDQQNKNMLESILKDLKSREDSLLRKFLDNKEI